MPTLYGQSDFNLRIVSSNTPAYTLVGRESSVNNHGVVAFTAHDADGSRVFVAVVGDTITSRPVSPDFGAFRDYQGVAISSQGCPDGSSCSEVVARLLITQPRTIIRKWRVSNSAETTLGDSMTTMGQADFDAAFSPVDINDAGVVVFSAATDGTTVTSLFMGPTEPAVRVVSYSGNVLLYPQLSNPDGSGQSRAIVRDTQGRIISWSFPSRAAVSYANATVTPDIDLATTGQRPGISSDAAVAAFVATKRPPAADVGPGVFVSVLSGFPSRQTIRVAGAPLGDGFTAFPLDQRVGVERLVDGTGAQHIRIVFAASRGTRSGAYVKRLVIREGIGQVEPGFATVAEIGDPVEPGQRPISEFTLYDPMSSCGWGALTVGIDGTTHVVRADGSARSSLGLPDPSHLFKQADSRWADCCLLQVPHCPRQVGDGSCPTSRGRAVTFQKSGCVVASFATAVARQRHRAGMSTTNITPVVVRDYLADQKLEITSIGEVPLEKAVYEADNYKVWTERTLGSDFGTIISELRAGNVLILAVPSRTRSIASTRNRDCHYIVAYGYDENIAAAAGDASAIHIWDPGNADSAYGRMGQAGYVPTGKHKTLHDYFAATSARSAAGHVEVGNAGAQFDYFGRWGECALRDDMRIKDWFNLGRMYYRDASSDSQTATLSFTPQWQRQNLITKIRGAMTPAARRVRPAIGRSSPVELRLIDPISNRSYATDAAIAQPGDVLLSATEVPPVASSEDVDETGGDPFPTQFWDLPDDLYGRGLDYQIIGVGTGPYVVSYLHPNSDFLPPDPVEGQISPGEVVQGTFRLFPSRCPADLDDGSGSGTPDGGVTIDDLLYYLDQYAQGTTRADLDDGSGTGTPDGGVTIDDLLYYLVRYEAGC